MDCNRGEAKHQELKRTMLTCSGRDGDVLRHFARYVNTSMALKALKGRSYYLAKVYRRHKGWEDVVIRSSADCAKAMDILDGVLPLGESIPDVPVGTTPHGGRTWSAILRQGRDNRSASASSTLAVGETPPSIVPGAVALEEAYETWFSCDRQGREDGVRCGSHRCPICWTVGNEGMSRQIKCSNWDAYEDSDSLSSGPVTIKGASFDCLYSDDVLREVLGDDGGTDVQMARDANRSGQHPLARIMLFFDHTPGIPPPGVGHHEYAVTWAVVLEYVTRGKGQNIETDTATELPMYELRRTPKLYPADFVTQIVHMTHACTSSGSETCRLGENEAGRPIWIHNHSSRIFLHNNYYEYDLSRKR